MIGSLMTDSPIHGFPRGVSYGLSAVLLVVASQGGCYCHDFANWYFDPYIVPENMCPA